jgi:Holliday junction DNA helicase RuvA
MIAQLEGTITHVEESCIIINVHNIGYRVNLAKNAALDFKIGENLFLWTYLAVRENSLDLYGFTTHEEHKMFEKLLTLPGVGPKTAMGYLSAASVETLHKAISSQDVGYLTKISGIGRKSAEKILTGLKDKMDKFEASENNPRLSEEADVIEAIKSLGYTIQDARNALHALPPEIVGVSNKIKTVLKYLGK